MEPPVDPAIAHMVAVERKTLAQATQIMFVQARGSTVIEGAKVELGDRVAEARYSPDGPLILYLLDPAEADRVAVARIARSAGIEEWVRVESFRPEWVAGWRDLSVELARLWQLRPTPLTRSPTPGPGYRMPPHSVTLVSTAGSIAAELHRRFGADVELTVGALPYPPDRVKLLSRAARRSDQPMPPGRYTAALDGELSVRSGRTTEHGLWLHNHSDRSVTVHTNGRLHATIVDPATGAPVGRSTGVERMPLVRFIARPGDRIRVPVLVGTDSVDPNLGYAVPAGQWALVVQLPLSDRRVLDTPPLRMTVS